MNDKERMIGRHLKGRDIDSPLPIGQSQTISQPYIVAYMAQALELNKDDKVLEVGSGCGYNAAVLAQLAGQVYSIEIIEWLADLAQTNLAKTDIDNVEASFVPMTGQAESAL